jgi:hypothetical protein
MVGMLAASSASEADPIQQVPVLRDYIDRTDIVDAREPVASVLLIPPELPWSAGFTTFEGRVETE